MSHGSILFLSLKLLLLFRRSSYCSPKNSCFVGQLGKEMVCEMAYHASDLHNTNKNLYQDIGRMAYE